MILCNEGRDCLLLPGQLPFVGHFSIRVSLTVAANIREQVSTVSDFAHMRRMLAHVSRCTKKVHCPTTTVKA